MKYAILFFALVAPSLAAAYPDPNIALQISAGDLVDTMISQPMPTQIILSDVTPVSAPQK